MAIKKTQISIQTFFFILMGICFIWILFFGYKQIANVNDQLSEQERIEIENELKHALEYCNEQLNRGSVKIQKISSQQIDGLCISGTPTPPLLTTDEAKTILSAGDNVILFKNKQIVGSFFAEGNFKVQCYEKGKNSTLNIIFKCE